MTARGPTAIRIRDREIDCGGAFFFPNSARNLFAVQQVMLDAGVDAAPVTAVERLVDDATNFYVNPVAAENPVVDAPQQIEQPALFPFRGAAGRFIRFSPGFRFVWRHDA